MNYIVKLNYMDGQEINVALPKEEVGKFLEKLSKNEPYWAPDAKTAFLTKSDNVRYTNAVLAATPEPAVSEPDIKPKEETKEENLPTTKEHEGSTLL